MTVHAGTDVEQFVRDAYRAMETVDVARVATMLADDLQAVDGLMRTWKRGLGEVGAHLSALESSLQRWGSQLSDMHVQEYGDIAIATYQVEEKYSFQGVDYVDIAPTSMVLRRVDGEWRIVLFQSVPMPPEK
jgi:ketosteroid isomerase-like protein